jgi:superfamily II DNA or RNA helicase
MQLRPRQKALVDRFVAALHEHKSTLAVAPTGAGKTVMLSAVGGALGGAGLVLQHRDELVTQNARTFHKVNPSTPLSLYTADRKRWERKGWTFGMVGSVVNALAKLDPGDVPHVDTVLVDEAHHTTANSYIKTIELLRRKNPGLLLGGFTATPMRGDKRGLSSVFRSVADQISYRELIEGGFLVRPRTFVIDVGVRTQLESVRKLPSDFDMEAVAAIMDHAPVNTRVVEEWAKVAGDRRTVVFCANVAHAEHVAAAWQAAGYKAAVVEGSMAGGERERVLAAFDRGEIQIIVNVAVLTEGWDCQPVSCVVLLRPSSFKSTMIQMVGRGLRKLDPERYPGIVKTDCVVLDFGTSILTHGSIEADAHALRQDHGRKDCPQCNTTIPDACPECPMCGYEWPKQDVSQAPRVCTGCGHENAANAQTCKACGLALVAPKEKEALADFVLTEVDLFNQSPFAWEELWSGAVWMACSFESWAAVVNVAGEWFAVGGATEGDRKGVHLLAARQNDRLLALAAGDDWMRECGDAGAAAKTKRWLTMPISDKQREALGVSAMEAIGVTRYRAACLMTWKWSQNAIRAKVMGARG